MSGKRGLVIGSGRPMVSVKSAGSIAGAYGAGPSLAHTARRASRWSLQVISASLTSADACSLHALAVEASDRFAHFAMASDLSLRASSLQAFSAPCALALHASLVLPGEDLARILGAAEAAVARSSVAQTH